MKKAALIIYNEENKNKDSFLNKLKEWFDFLISNKVEHVVFEEDDFELLIVEMPKVRSAGKRLVKVLKWIQEENIELVAFDDYLIKEYGKLIKQFAQSNNVEIFYGHNVYFPVAIRILKKLLKAKGLELSELEMAMVTDGTSPFEDDFIENLAPHVKYLTYISNESSKVERIIDDIFVNSGISIRRCSNIKECLEDVGLIINLTEGNIIPSEAAIKNKILLFNVSNELQINAKNLSVLNDINIDISRLEICKALKNNHKYMIAEMYILSKLGKLNLLNQRGDKQEHKDIYDCFKESGFKVKGFNGVNL